MLGTSEKQGAEACAAEGSSSVMGTEDDKSPEEGQWWRLQLLVALSCPRGRAKTVTFLSRAFYQNKSVEGDE